MINAVTGHDAAIVSEIAGTTRDSVTIDAEIDGHPVKLIDTAGIEVADSAISRLSQQQADLAGAHADVRIWCVDSSRDDFADACRDVQRLIDEESRDVLDICTATKSDLNAGNEVIEGWIATSAATGAGIDSLRQAIAAAIDQRDGEEVGSVVGTAARCGQSLSAATTAMGDAIRLTRSSQGHEFVAAELRTAVMCLGEVTGAVYTDDILDRVFGRFCIGK